MVKDHGDPGCSRALEAIIIIMPKVVILFSSIMPESQTHLRISSQIQFASL
jgi:hypothetical protein